MIGALISLAHIIYFKKFNFNQLAEPTKSLLIRTSLTLGSLLFAAFLASTLRGSYVASEFDAPSRLLLAIPVLYFLFNQDRNPINYLSLTIPFGLFIALVDQLFLSQAKAWDPVRWSTHFVDPLAFGYINLALGLTSLGFALQKHINRSTRILNLCTGILGMYLSLMSQSRTGWLAIPIILLIILILNRKKLKFKYITSAAILFITTTTLLFNYSLNFKNRVNDTLADLNAYTFSGVAPDNSVGMRITFLRIASDLISEKPFSGYGDTIKNKPEVPANVKNYSSAFIIDFSLSSGFHNEIITSGIHHGIAGSLSIILIFYVFLSFFLKNKHSMLEKKFNNFPGIFFITTLIISSFSTEIFGLKYTTSFFALTSVLLLAAATHHEA
ncbi:MAG: hypothetical protein RLZZ107_356 [Bacteroidota bacterium]